jgi:hypothetical protein
LQCRLPQEQGGPARQFGAIPDPEFGQQRGDVEFHRAHGDVELRGDLFIGALADHGMQDLFLPRTQGCGCGRLAPDG